MMLSPSSVVTVRSVFVLQGVVRHTTCSVWGILKLVVFTRAWHILSVCGRYAGYNMKKGFGLVSLFYY